MKTPRKARSTQIAAPAPTLPAARPYAPGEAPELRVEGLPDPAGERPIPFDPVPRRRLRRDGWTEEAQRLFIEALAETGSVARAARVAGMSARSAYRLAEAPGADSFAAAWDIARATALESARQAAFARVTDGAWVAIRRRGKIVREELRFNDRLAIALLSGAGRTRAESSERMVSRRRHRERLLATRAVKAEEQRRAEAVRAEHQALLDRIEHERLNPPKAEPRVRRL